MKTYKSNLPAQVDGVYYKPGEPFATDAKPSEGWEAITVKEAVATEAALNPVPDDADLEALPKSALQAVAFLRHVPQISNLKTEDALRTAIRASYEPRL